ncbi:beta-lactamase [Sphaerisporangium rufum]|uniref:Beta-lactamase n=1 Tax=Sphaerisporangium rufum TaxID=1381558 RepID=A0A919R6N1_9ACTN|nr:class A beta-lactamase [Sphaerisporangium rufum]GII78127.1 beta-lactamase [Sphaerisporangium rufum]
MPDRSSPRRALTILASLVLAPLTGYTGACAAAGVPAAAPPTTAVPETAPAHPAAPAPAALARKRLRALEASFDGRIGAYAIDTATGRTVGHRAGERVAWLSTFKAFAAAAVLHKARTTEPGLMDKVVRWTAADVKENSPVTEKHVADGMTVAELCEAAITVSDNTAANMVLRQIGGPAGLTRYFRTLKDPLSRLDRWETELNDWSPKDRRDTTTPAAAGRDLRAVTAGGALTAKDRDRLIGWLAAAKTGDARIRAGLPAGWKVGDKTGTTSKYGTANDIAIIWPGGTAAPIIMAIYTNRKAVDAPVVDKVVADTATILARGLGRL